MRKLRTNNYGSIYPVIILFICLGLTSFLVLLFGNVLTPFFQLISSTDPSVDAAVLAPMGYMSMLLQWIWPRGVLLVILFGLIFWLLMDYQKNRYKEEF